MKEYRNKNKNFKKDHMCNHTACATGTELGNKRTKYCPVLSQGQYLSLFDAKKYGQLHDQK